MSILDTVKSKFRTNNDDDWDDEYDDYGDDDYDDYDDADEIDEDIDDNGTSGGVASWPEGLDNADRRSSRLEDGMPLVTNTDVRSTFRANDRAAHQQVNAVPNYDSATSNYKIEARDGLSRSSNHSPESLEAARQELDQLQQGMEVPLDSYSNGGPKVTPASRRIETVRIRSYEDAQKISEAIKAGSSVAVSLATVEPGTGKRVLDFCFGVVSVVDGSFESLGNNVYFLARGGGQITETEKQELKDEGLL